MTPTNALIISYLQGVADGRPGHLNRSFGGREHSDRHHALLEYYEYPTRTDAPSDLIREAAALEACRTHHLAAVIDALAQAAIPSLILKGAAFSHTVYPQPYLRPRNDDDLWIRRADLDAACTLLEQSGYVRAVEISAAQITRQIHFSGERAGFLHQIDLHWWPVNPPAFDGLPDFDACLAASVPLPAIGRTARALGPVHALVFACAHRVAHHTSTEDAMWLCDLHLLASALTRDQWADVVSVAMRARVARVCGTELARAVSTLASPVPADVIQRLCAVRREPSARYLRALGPLRDLWLALRDSPTLGRRVALLRGHLLPPRSYMAARYGYDGRIGLPWLYVRRAIAGATRWTCELVSRLVTG